MGGGLHGGGADRRHSVFRYVIARGLVIMAIIFALGVAGTASLFIRASEERVLAERHLPALVTASRLFTSTTMLAALSTRLLTVDTRPEMLTLMDRIASRSAAVAAEIEALEGLGLAPDKAERARRTHQELAAGNGALADLTRQIMAVNGAAPADRLDDLLLRRERLIHRQELLSSEMTTLVSGLTRETELQVIAFQENAFRASYMMTAALAGGGLLSVVAVFGIYIGLRRHVLDRLSTMTDALREWRHGRQPNLVADNRGDEISEMSGILHDLIGIVDRRTQELSAQAQTDVLTGMYNRRGFQDRAEAELTRAVRYGTPLSVLVGDIDHFKAVNDTYGHGIGDEALRHVAALWRDVLRDMDVSGRLGGEEFAALLPHTALADARLVAERIRVDIADALLAVEGFDPLVLTISIGVATLEPGEGLASLLGRADTALYAAKRAGRNRVLVADAASESQLC